MSHSQIICTLTLYGVIPTLNAYQNLLNALRTYGADNVSTNPLFPKNGKVRNTFFFNNAATSAIEPTLQKLLEDLKLAYVWDWNTRDTFQEGPVEGMFLRNPATGDEITYRTIDGEYALPFSHAINSAKLLEYQRTQMLQLAIMTGPLLVAQSGHHLMQLLDDNPEMKTFFIQTQDTNAKVGIS